MRPNTIARTPDDASAPDDDQRPQRLRPTLAAPDELAAIPNALGSQHSEDAEEGAKPIEELEDPLIKALNDRIALPRLSWPSKPRNRGPSEAEDRSCAQRCSLPSRQGSKDICTQHGKSYCRRQDEATPRRCASTDGDAVRALSRIRCGDAPARLRTLPGAVCFAEAP